MGETFEQQYPVSQALDIISERVAEGWSLLGIEGLWVDGDGVRPDLDFIFDGSPDGVRDLEAVSSMLAAWPQADSFCVEVLMVR